MASHPGQQESAHPGTPRALSFDSVAAQYATSRPSYPPQLFDTIEELTGHPLDGRRVVDVGAGTGIATRLLAARGARVLAVEPGPAMGEQLREALPDVPLLRAVGDALPLATASTDLITYAQSWHWTDPARSVPEAMRVLAPGGALALWWNIPDTTVPWIAEQEDRLARRLDAHRHGTGLRAPRLITEADPALRPVRRELHWTRRVPLDQHIAHLGSHSYVARLGPHRAAPLLDQERTEVLRVFPGGIVEETYALHLTVTLRRADP
ncbi:class I SAM-dependent methyltransferase [Streptomyces triticagri]|uniref:Class I SAM-dependent methyltransferase n=1 Tax=Streptomyces triticagri TaxID=2293568 RepID=A0A372M9S4_9ACTN|nr:class I SAM-dependent methyltransferase [Streptomyces triticagri]RFU87183.1 class I SAM-dependent methyltransferase [Streptomyces triticagri]